MGADDLISSGKDAARELFFANQLQLDAYFEMDRDLGHLRIEAGEIADSDELRMRRAEKLQRLAAREVFAAGAALMAGPEDKPFPRPVVVAVTDDDLVLLDARVEVVPEDEIGRIPRREITGVRLLDQRGEPVQPLSEVEELDANVQPYLVYVDREIEGQASGHVFVFLSYSVAAEAERDFRRQLPA